MDTIVIIKLCIKSVVHSTSFWPKLYFLSMLFILQLFHAADTADTEGQLKDNQHGLIIILGNDADP